MVNRVSPDTEKFQPPPLGDVLAYRGVYVLGTTRTDPETGRQRLTASHYASCLVFGKQPVWGVWTAAGKFVRFYGLKDEIFNAYPHLVWRRKMASWSLLAVDDLRAEERRKALEQRYRQSVPTPKTEAAE